MSAEDGRPAEGRAGRTSPGALLNRLGKLARDPALRGIASVFVMKCSIIVANFTLIMLAARVLDTEHFGVFSVMFSAAGLFYIVATFGQQVSIMRWWNEYTAANDPAMLKGVLRFSLATCLIGCAVVAAGFYFWAAATHTVLLAAAVTLYMVSQASVLTSSHLVRTAIGVGAGDGYGNLFVGMPALIYLAAILAMGGTAEASSVFLLFRSARLPRCSCISSSCGGKFRRFIRISLWLSGVTTESIGAPGRSSSGSRTGSKPQTNISTC